jgi:5'-nucleotidase
VIITQAKLLKDQGANAIIIVGHVGNDCGADTKYGIWTQQKMGDIKTCDKNDEVFALIDSLPNKTIDAVVQGHRHSTSHYFYKGIPIMGTINGGSYLNSLRLYFKL